MIELAIAYIQWGHKILTVLTAFPDLSTIAIV